MSTGRLDLGTRVSLTSLKATEHNGKHGTICGYQGERYKVKLDAEDRTLALKEANVIESKDRMWVPRDYFCSCSDFRDLRRKHREEREVQCRNQD